jgi:hypothetical protein
MGLWAGRRCRGPHDARLDRRTFTLLFVCGSSVQLLRLTYFGMATIVHFPVAFNPIGMVLGAVGGAELARPGYGKLQE